MRPNRFQPIYHQQLDPRTQAANITETVAECGAGDPQAARERLELIGKITLLDLTEDAERLTELLIEQVPQPHQAQIDAVHIAIATVNGIDYLSTGNCAHIAHATLQPQIETVCRSTGFEPPTICTPQQLMED